MFPVATTQAGMSQAVPDVCKTPVGSSLVPLPYVNVALMNQANPATCALKVKIMMKPVVTKKSIILVSSGDEPGTGGGVVSGVIKGPAKFRTGSAKVKIEGHPVVFQTCLVGQNGNSANMPAGVHCTPSQMKVKVMM